MRTVFAALAVLLIPAGCDRPAAPPAAAPIPAPAVPPPAVSPPVVPPPVVPPPVVPPAGAPGLTFVDAVGAPAATLTCGPAGLRIVVAGFQPIGSEDRLSIGMEGEAFALVADLAAPGPGVTASGDPDPELLDRLSRGEALYAVYGQQAVGPLAASSAGALQTLVSACRRGEQAQPKRG